MATREAAQDTLVERLSKVDACAASDALDRLGMKGSVIGLRPLTVTAKITGRVVTTRMKAFGGERSTRHLGAAAIEAANPGDVIVIDHRGRLDCAAWGGILSNGAKVSGVAGVIVDGAVRDVDESRELGLPVYGRAGVQVTARTRIIEESCNEPIEMCGVWVKPGDLVIADSSGVVFISADHAEDVVAAAEDIAAREALMTKDVRAGKPISQVMGANYETMLERK